MIATKPAEPPRLISTSRYATLSPTGRFAERERVNVTGSEPIPAALPAPAWSRDPVGDEPALGFVH